MIVFILTRALAVDMGQQVASFVAGGILLDADFEVFTGPLPPFRFHNDAEQAL